jgi:hypothetical protein
MKPFLQAIEVETLRGFKELVLNLPRSLPALTRYTYHHCRIAANTLTWHVVYFYSRFLHATTAAMVPAITSASRTTSIQLIGPPPTCAHLTPVECQQCKAKQKVHVAVRPCAGAIVRQTILCIECERDFDVMVPDKIISGPFPL